MLCSLALCLSAQDEEQFKSIITELSSARYQGRGYARDGVVKAGKYIADEFRKAGADEVTMQPFCIDINTFPGKMKMSVDGHKLTPGRDFVVREYSAGAKGRGGLYFIDTLNYDSARIFADLAKPENAGCYVVCDFWFTYKHGQDFKKMEARGECLNAGMIYTWNTPLKFYKAYGDKVRDKAIIWTTAEVLEGAEEVKVNIENEFLGQYESSNVIAKVEGERHDSCYVFTAHYDHLGNMGRRLYFPGANDNASGTAGIITLARHYKLHKPAYDMYFVAVSGEEANLRGSTWFAEHPAMPLGSIRYLFNLDMICDNNPEQYCEVSDAGMAGFRRFEELNARGQYFKTLKRGELAANSDHWPFAQRGVPCIFFENKSGEAFPYYHTAEDDLETARFETFRPLMQFITDFINTDK